MQVPDQSKRLLSSTSLIVIAAFVVRMGFLYYDMHHFYEPSVRDNQQFGAELGSIAASIAAGHGFSSPMRLVPTGPTAHLTPIYPYLVGGIFKLFGTFSYESSVLIRTIQCILSALTCWPVFAIGKRAFGRSVGVAAACSWAVYPAATYFAILWVWDTSLLALWMALLLAATLRLRGSDRISWWIGYGALWGVGAMINPSILSVLPVLALWAIWPLRNHLAHAARLGLASSLIFAACILPWAVRNYEVFHAFIPFRSNFGLEWWLDNHTQYPDRSFHPTDYPPELEKYVRMTELPYMEEKKREAWAFVRAYPADEANFILHRFVATWTSISESPADLWRTIPFSVKALIVANCGFSLLALMGALFALRSRNDAAAPMAAVLLIFPIIFYITHAELRYRFPIDPLMMIFAVYGVSHCLSLAKQAALNLQHEAPSHAADESFS